MDETDLTSLIKEAEESLKIFVGKTFKEKNSYLLNKYSEEEILEIYKFCLLQPSGKSWAPINQALLLLFQASFSESIKKYSNRFVKMGNYIIHKLPRKNKPIVYSFGIGTDISFDISASNNFDIPIYMYDPTPKVNEYMRNFSNNKKLKFVNEGVFSEEKDIKFYLSDIENKVNSSIYPIHGKNGKSKYVKCRTLKSFMRSNNHDRIDILKMDIEGAAIDVLEHMINETNIRPMQIVTEIEVLNIENPITYLPRVIRLMDKMKSNNYQIFNQKLTRKASIELIFVHQSIMKKKLDRKFNLIYKYISLLKNDFITLIKKYKKILKNDFNSLTPFD